MTSLDLTENVNHIRRSLESAALERWGRAPEIIAVSKTVPAERVNQLKACGLYALGENRVQEILEKLPNLDAQFKVDMIGRLQNNKVKYIIDKVAMIQSLDRMSLAQEIDKRAKQHGLKMPVLIQINIGREPQKGGLPEEELLPFAKEITGLDGLELRGIMAVMPDTGDEEVLRPLFVRMRTMYEHLQAEGLSGTRIDELSMGMSGDYLLAAQEGATHVRLGSAIFGTRAIKNSNLG